MAMDKLWSNSGQTLVKLWSHAGFGRGSEREKDKRRERERGTRGCEPLDIHVAIHEAMLGECMETAAARGMAALTTTDAA